MNELDYLLQYFSIAGCAAIFVGGIAMWSLLMCDCASSNNHCGNNYITWIALKARES